MDDILHRENDTTYIISDKIMDLPRYAGRSKFRIAVGCIDFEIVEINTMVLFPHSRHRLYPSMCLANILCPSHLDITVLTVCVIKVGLTYCRLSENDS